MTESATETVTAPFPSHSGDEPPPLSIGPSGRRNGSSVGVASGAGVTTGAARVVPVTDDEFLRRTNWTEDAPNELRGLAAAGEWKKFARAWFGSLPKTTPYRRLAGFGPAGGSCGIAADADFWQALRQAGVPFAPELVETAARFEESGREAGPAQDDTTARKRRSPKRKSRPKAGDATQTTLDGAVRDWLAAADESRRASFAASADLLILADLVLFAGSELSGETRRGLVRRLLESAASFAGESSFSGENSADGGASDFRGQAALSAELAFKLGLLCRGLSDAVALVDAGRRGLCERLSSLTDSTGRPLPSTVERFRLALGPLVRAAVWGDLFQSPLLSEDDAKRFATCVRSLVGLCRPDGGVALSKTCSDGRRVENAPPTSDVPAAATPGDVAFLDLAASVAGFRRKSRPRSLLATLPHRGDASPTAPRRLDDVPTEKRASFQSDDASLACLRTTWSPQADLIAVAHSAAWPRLDVSLRGRPVLRGLWELEVRRDGRSVELNGAWKSTCWFSDDDADYLELQQILSDGTHIERQILLSRSHRFLVLADCVSHVGTSPVELRSRLPYAPNVVGTNETATREAWLQSDLVAARVFPLALEDDRLRPSTGSLVATDAALELRQTGVGGLFAPLVIDWHPDRANEPADWRTLTVCENGTAVPRATASGHRCRVGKHQVVVYRSLVRNDELRTVLGHHTPHETVIALFDKDGDVHPLLLVE